ncbi:hypothetical protein LCGC14_0340890 [marine sediment metagenome]|uniref:Uncharacterized protein n=1 Tax=marine sediment metagenome TaxID=412755 RepID=A0A0F9TWM2_9ZZZZ
MTYLIIALVAMVVFGVLAKVMMGKWSARWYKVYLANPEQNELRVYRTLWDRWWALDASSFVAFRRQGGEKVRINKHWIIKIESEINGDN